MAYKKITKAQLDYLKTQQDIKTVNASLITVVLFFEEK